MTFRPLLIVDDNPHNLHLVTFLLKGEGLEVRTAQTAEEALSMLAAENFSLILTDVRLPGMDGLELIRRIRAMPAHESVPIIALTALATREDETQALAAGCNAYIRKPIDARAFPGRVREFLGLHASEGAVVMDPAIAGFRSQFLPLARSEARELLALSNEDLGGPATFEVLHKWAGFGTSVGLRPLTELAREAEGCKTHPAAVRGERIRRKIASIAVYLDSAY